MFLEAPGERNLRVRNYLPKYSILKSDIVKKKKKKKNEAELLANTNR